MAKRGFLHITLDLEWSEFRCIKLKVGMVEEGQSLKVTDVRNSERRRLEVLNEVRISEGFVESGLNGCSPDREFGWDDP